jgi:sporulation protein YqfC
MKRKLKEEYNHIISEICREKMYLNTHICICDNKRIEVENCKRIMEYNDIYVKIKTSTLILQVWGENIVISDYNMDGIIIEGKISSIEFL